MLHYRTVEPATLDILKGLCAIPELENFFLVGGTCLALRYGHRTSVDLDLFSTEDFNNEEIIAGIKKTFPQFSYRNTKNPVGVFGYIDGVKVDLVRHYYFKQIDQAIMEDGVRMFGDRDVIAMKIFAILKRAQKKDFWDVAELLQHYSVQDFIDCYYEKYPNTELLISIPHALTYFLEADESEAPVSLKGQTWPGVKKAIQQKVSDYLQ